MQISKLVLTGARPPAIYRLNTRAKPNVVLDGLVDADWRHYYLDGHKIYDKPSFLKESAKALHFPDYFGQNWDAFEECIRDLPPAKGYVILYDQVDQFAIKELEEWQIALDILSSAVAFWRKTDTPLYIFFRNTGRWAARLPLLGSAGQSGY